MIRVTREPTSGAAIVSTSSEPDLRMFRDEFSRRHCVVLHRFLSDGVLEQVQREIAAAEFVTSENERVSTELYANGGRAPALLSFLVNDQNLFSFVEHLSGCGEIRSFVGRVYRMLPGSEHEVSWHDDLEHGRLIAMSINLSTAPYSGGRLEIREECSKEVLTRVGETAQGDAVIFRVAPELQHRVTAVEGDNARTAYAGWFTSEASLPWERENGRNAQAETETGASQIP